LLRGIAAIAEHKLRKLKSHPLGPLPQTVMNLGFLKPEISSDRALVFVFSVCAQVHEAQIAGFFLH